MVKYGLTVTIPGSIDAVKPQVQEALKTQGFGILTEINIQKVLQEKIGADYDPYLILGACNPNLSNQALHVDPYIGLLLPCNVILRQMADQVEVSILDPEVMFSVVDPSTQSALVPMAQEARTRLQGALVALANLKQPAA